MKIVIIGYGKVGRQLCQVLIEEGHDITVIDNDPNQIESAISEFDVMGICGNGASAEILNEASVEGSDVVIASTPSDELNILACLMCKKLKVKYLISRCRNYEYAKQMDMMKKEIGIDLFINPELEAANEIKNIIQFPEAISIERFASGLVDIIELFVPASSPLIGLSLQQVHSKYNADILICAVRRGEEVFIPRGDYTFSSGDHIHITSKKSEIKTFLKKLDLIESKVKNVLIIGGGKISYYLIEALIKSKINVKIIEKDYNRCVELSEKFSEASIVCGDGSNEELLLSEGLRDTDALICLTGLDEENILISMYAEKLNVPKIIAKVNKSSFKSLIESIGFASVIAPKTVTTSRILRFVRGISQKSSSSIDSLYKFVDDKVEAIQLTITEDASYLNKELKTLKIKKNVLIAVIIRDDEVIIPRGNTCITKGDKLIIVCQDEVINNFSDILE